MRSAFPLLLVLLACGNFVGCGSSHPSTELPPVVPDDPIAKVVYEFLDAVRSGDTEGLSQLLTPLAYERTREFVFTPPESDTASFSVGRVEQLDDKLAVVEAVWTELGADGQPQGQRITCALKLFEGSWKVNGMAAELGENERPVIIDFENPRELIGPASRRAAKARLQPSGAPRQATKPLQDPFRTSAG